MENRIETISIKIEKSSEKTYIKIPFCVPQNVEKMTIRYSYEGDGASSLPTGADKNCIDIGLLGPDGSDYGTTGSSYREITISAAFSTPGYKRTELTPGEWTILCGAYMVMEKGVEVKYEIEYTFKHYRWIKGDLHLHTVNSDGKLTVQELGELAKKRGLDFIFTSDHNNYFHNSRLPDIPGLTIIPGTEFTNYYGHMNMLGVEKPYDHSFAVNSLEEFKILNNEAKEKGAIQSLNHPLCTVCPWKWGFEGFHYDMVEIWNGPMRQDNLNAIKWWKEQLKRGKKLPATGGSDYHNNFAFISFFAFPTTYVYACSTSPSDILDGIKAGRMVVARNSKASVLEIRCGNSICGDSISYKNGLTLDVNIDKLTRGHKLTVYNGDNVVYEFKAKSGKRHTASVPAEKKGYYLAEIMYSPGLFERIIAKIIAFAVNKKELKAKVPDYIYAITNPIYFD
jgi:hypothetical protein